MRPIDADAIPWNVDGVGEIPVITKEEIDSMPTVDAEPVRHGKWIDIDSQMYTWKVRCDQCGHERSMMSTQGRYPKYCENCGAKMDGVQENQNDQTD